MKPTYIQPKLRLPPELHSQLKREAEKNRIPFNREVLNRLWESFDMRPHRTLEELAEYYRSLLVRLEHWERVTRSEVVSAEHK